MARQRWSAPGPADREGVDVNDSSKAGPQAIPTRYAGYHFRSRLEARWAVFFDALKLEWQYEPEGFIIGIGQRPYLPDFRLPKLNLWVEVKGTTDGLDFGLLADAVDYGCGLPGIGPADTDKDSLLILGPVPVATKSAYPCHHSLDWQKGWQVRQGYFGIDRWVGVRYYPFLNTGFCGSASGGPESCDSALGGFGSVPALKLLDAGFLGDFTYGLPCEFGPALRGEATDTPDLVIDAYRAARSARFEHGHSGAS